MELGFNKRRRMIKRRNPSGEDLSSTCMKNEQSKCKLSGCAHFSLEDDSKLEFMYNNWTPIHRIYAWIRANEDNNL